MQHEALQRLVCTVFRRETAPFRCCASLSMHGCFAAETRSSMRQCSIFCAQCSEERRPCSGAVQSCPCMAALLHTSDSKPCLSKHAAFALYMRDGPNQVLCNPVNACLHPCKPCSARLATHAARTHTAVCCAGSTAFKTLTGVQQSISWTSVSRRAGACSASSWLAAQVQLTCVLTPSASQDDTLELADTFSGRQWVCTACRHRHHTRSQSADN